MSVPPLPPRSSILPTKETEPEPDVLLLLSIPSVLLSIHNSLPTPQPLELLCLSKPIPLPTTTASSSSATPVQDRDIWLILRIGPLESALQPTHRIAHSPTQRTFEFPDANPPFSITFPPPSPSSPGVEMALETEEDLDTFTLLLREYGVLLNADGGAPPAYSAAPPTDGKGHLILVDNSTGSVLGTVASSVELAESSTLNAQGDGKGPVLIDLPEDSSDAATVSPLPAGMDVDDPIIATATTLARGLTTATTALSTGLTYASSFYISRVAPAPGGPTPLSPQARANIARVHAVSGQAVRVTAKATGAVHSILDKVITKISTSASGMAPASATAAGNNPNVQMAGRVLGRVLIGADLLLTTVESSASQLVTATTSEVSRSLEHRYGPDVGDATRLVGDAVRNVGVVYVDARGVGRRALLGRAGKKAIEATIRGQKVMLEGAPGVDTSGSGIGGGLLDKKNPEIWERDGLD